MLRSLRAAACCMLDLNVVLQDFLNLEVEDLSELLIAQRFTRYDNLLS